MNNPDSPQMKPNKRFDHIFVVMRAERDWYLAGKDLEMCISVAKAFYSEQAAQQEVDRLNDINADKGCYYFYQLGRLERSPANP